MARSISLSLFSHHQHHFFVLYLLHLLSTKYMQFSRFTYTSVTYIPAAYIPALYTPAAYLSTLHSIPPKTTNMSSTPAPVSEDSKVIPTIQQLLAMMAENSASLASFQYPHPEHPNSFNTIYILAIPNDEVCWTWNYQDFSDTVLQRQRLLHVIGASERILDVKFGFSEREDRWRGLVVIHIWWWIALAPGMIDGNGVKMEEDA
jgi:hypothetical protein